MRLNYIYLDGYKNLSKLDIVLDSQSAIAGLIGNNGSGKSNILEALTVILSHVKSNIPVDFSYCIEYTIDTSTYRISNKDSAAIVTCNEKRIPQSKLANALPGTIFLYYCGETKRLSDFAQQHVDKDFERTLKSGGVTSLKYLTYITVDDFGAALLASIAFDSQIYHRIAEIVKITGVKPPITMIITKPQWGNKRDIGNLWNAVGAVRTELEKLKSISSKYTIEADSIHIEIIDFYQFTTKWFSSLDLFIALKMLMQAGLLHSIDFDVAKSSGDRYFCYTGLSEGEKQLSQLLSLLDITKDHRALFLLDEFDSYLHPNWQRKFADILRSIQMEGQILFTSHSPLTIGKLNMEQVTILKDGKAFSPAADTYNRDITEILEEVMDVGRRPREIEQAIKDFKKAALQGEKQKAQELLLALKPQLSEDDPFFITADHLLSHIKQR